MEEMSNVAALECLVVFNEWRRGERDDYGDPETIGRAIDYAIGCIYREFTEQVKRERPRYTEREPTMTKIEALIEAGKKATQDELQSLTSSGSVYDAINYRDIMHGSCCNCTCYFDRQEDADFTVMAFNARADIEEMLAENKRLRAALEYYRDLPSSDTAYEDWYDDEGQRAREALGETK